MRNIALIGTLMISGLGASGASADALEEVVARASRADVIAEQASFEATMDAYASGVDAALKSEMRKHLTEQARPRLRIALAGMSHRG
jgi:hypothetical protein